MYGSFIYIYGIVCVNVVFSLIFHQKKVRWTRREYGESQDEFLTYTSPLPVIPYNIPLEITRPEKVLPFVGRGPRNYIINSLCVLTLRLWSPPIYMTFDVVTRLHSQSNECIYSSTIRNDFLYKYIFTPKDALFRYWV